MQKCLVIGWFLLVITSTASAGILTFDEIDTGGAAAAYMQEYTNLGFLISTDRVYHGNFVSFAVGSSEYNTTPSLKNNWRDGVTRLSTIDGSTFDLISIDLDIADSGTVTPDIQFIAYDSQNHYISSARILLVEDGWTTLNFTSAFTNVAYVEWSKIRGDHQFDNIVVNANVPIPGAVWLLGSGIIGLTGVRRKLKKY